MIATLDQSRACSHCGRLLPPSAFVFRSKARAQRRSVCKACNAEYHRFLRRRLRQKALRRFSAQLRRAQGIRRLVALVDAAIAKFNGLNGLADAWSNHVRHATQERPGGRTAGAAFRTLLHLIEVLDGQKQRDLGGVSGDELEQAINDYIVRRVLPRLRHQGVQPGQRPEVPV